MKPCEQAEKVCAFKRGVYRIMADGTAGEPMPDAIERIPTYVTGMDDHLQGGIPKGHLVLLAGSSGSMKSSLGFAMLYNAVLEGKASGIYVTLEQSKDSLAGHMAVMGMNVEDSRVRSNIAIIDLADLRVQLHAAGTADQVDWMGQLIKQLTSYRESIGFDVLVFDSLGAFFTLTQMDNPRDETFRFFEACRRLGLTTIIICEMMGEMKNQFGEFGIEDYLSDGVIHVTMERHGDAINRKLSVVKMRHTHHQLGYREFYWDTDTCRFAIR
jgi:circadian clock protein KaiC